MQAVYCTDHARNESQKQKSRICFRQMTSVLRMWTSGIRESTLVLVTILAHLEELTAAADEFVVPSCFIVAIATIDTV